MMMLNQRVNKYTWPMQNNNSNNLSINVMIKQILSETTDKSPIRVVLVDLTLPCRLQMNTFSR
jgi:hypothetical protein